jgi:hypothetical protein
MAKTQYLEGTGFENLENYVFSNSTLTQYVHYSQNFPTENTLPKYAGNYLLVVYRNFNEADIVLSRRIMVLSAKGNVDVDLGATFNRVSERDVSGKLVAVIPFLGSVFGIIGL